MENCGGRWLLRELYVCVCVHSDLQHLLVDAVVAVGAEVGLVLVLPQLGHSAQVARFAGFCAQNQTLSQQPEGGATQIWV